MRASPLVIAALTAATVFLAVPGARSAPAHGTIEVETSDATAHDRQLLDAVARELERHDSLWTSPAPRGTKTFRLKTYASGGVRGLTERRGTVDSVVACKLIRNRLWNLKLRSTAPRTLVITFRFRP